MCSNIHLSNCACFYSIVIYFSITPSDGCSRTQNKLVICLESEFQRFGLLAKKAHNTVLVILKEVSCTVDLYTNSQFEERNLFLISSDNCIVIMYRWVPGF